MKKSILIGFLVVAGTSLNGSFSVPDELNSFLSRDDAVQKMLDDIGPEKTLEKLKEWAGTSLQEFGAYYYPNDMEKVTVLHKFTQAGVTDEAILDFLLEDCDSNLESGTSRGTPLKVAEKTPALKARFEATSARRIRERLATFVRRWDEGTIKVKVDEILAYFNQENAPDIDTCQVTDAITVRYLLETSTKADEAKKILAYAAPYQSNKVAGLKSLIVGCCEGHVPTALLTKFLADNKAVPCDDMHIDLLFERGLKKYLDGQLSSSASKVRAQEICELLRTYSLALPKEMKRHTYFWTKYPRDWPSNKDDFSRLVRDCGQHDARMAEFEYFMKSCYSQRYSEYCDLVNTFEPLKDPVAYPRRDEVLKAYNSYRAISLFKEIPLAGSIALKKAVDQFTECVIESSLDIDTIEFNSGKTIGASLDTYPTNYLFVLYERQAFQEVQTILQCYRSCPPEAMLLLDLIRKHINSGTDLADISGYLKDTSLNIDLITFSKSQTIGEYLDAKSTEPAVAEILSLDGIKNFRTAALTLRRLIGKALEDEAAYIDLEAYYKKHPQNVDNLKMVSGETIGQKLAACLVGPKKKEAFRVAELVQTQRTEIHGVFRCLYGSFEKGNATFDELKAWVGKFPVGDVDTLLWDESHPGLGTFGDKINAQKNKALSGLFKAGRSKDPELVNKPKIQQDGEKPQSVEKHKGLMTRKNAAITFIVGAGIYMLSRSLKTKTQDDSARPAAV